MIEAIQTRLKTAVTDLKSVDGAADFTKLLQANRLPERTPAAFIVPLGLQGGNVHSATHQFIQGFRETLAVMLVFRSNDATGERALAQARNLIFGCIEALAGWAPNNEVGVFELARSNLINFSKEALVYQIEFAISDEVRITP